MEENESKDNEKVLHKVRCKLHPPNKNPEEAECFVTEGHVVIEAEETIKIPISHIKHVSDMGFIQYAFHAISSHRSLNRNVKLTFLDDLDSKHKLSLEMYFMDTGYFKKAIDNQRGPGSFGRFLGKVEETFRDKTRDNLCTELQSIGLDAQMAKRGRAEEDIERGDLSKSLGIIDIPEGPIRWINVIKRTVGGPGGGTSVDYFIKYGVPDSRIKSNLRPIEIKSTKKRGDLQWKGKDADLGIIYRLNSDLLLRDPLKYAVVKLKIHAYWTYRCWIISTEGYTVRSSISAELWSCYQAIARHLLAEWPK